MSSDRDEAVLRAARHAAAAGKANGVDHRESNGNGPTDADSGRTDNGGRDAGSASDESGRTDAAVVAAGLAGAVEVMDRLWKFGGWEVTQTHDSLRPYLLEETYELLDAIQHNDAETIKEELGDLLLQVLFHSRIAQAAGEFTVDDVAAALVAKLVNRSPHLADEPIDPAATVAEKIAAQEKAWDERKSAEKSRRSCLDGIAMAQPALALAEKIRSRSLKAGLPEDLIPAELRVIHLGGTDSAEERLRKATLTFASEIRAAEDAAEAARGERAPLSADDWYKYWLR
ncbi:MazG family protein [Nocardia sp. CA-129566]|uniref:MazG family protein n=1 Tax=Nocardia sp. CA-129566 TaxID=3239976 RepID=UPI003D964384